MTKPISVAASTQKSSYLSIKNDLLGRLGALLQSKNTANHFSLMVVRPLRISWFVVAIGNFLPLI